MTYVTPAIMIGGLGTRLWPLSRENLPKQFLKLFGDKSLFQQTLMRFAGEGYEPSWLMTSGSCYDHATRQMREIDARVGGLIAEPAMRGTAAAIAAVTLAIEDAGGGVVLVVPSDHNIDNTAALHDAVRRATPLAEEGYIVTFGLTPTAPETGYGYIQSSAPLHSDGQVVGFSVEKGGFLEKPDLARAREFVDNGYLWNAGIFLFHTETMLAELERHAPQTLQAARDALAAGSTAALHGSSGEDAIQLQLDMDAFCTAPADLSIDIAILEQSEKVAVVPVSDLGWNDIGSLSALWDVGQKDGAENVIKGAVLALDAHRNYVHSNTERRVVICGADDLIVVDNHDALLILPRDKAQSVKKVVAALKQESDSALRDTRLRHFDWGTIQVVHAERGHRTVMATVLPGCTLPRQQFNAHSETWTLITGSANVQSDRLRPIKPGASFSMDPAVRLSIENTGPRDIQLICVQVGPGLESAVDFGFTNSLPVIIRTNHARDEQRQELREYASI